MEAVLVDYSYTTQAFFASLFTWAITALGAAVVVFFKNINKTVMDGMLSLAAGVMMAASFWSLLEPSVDMAERLGMNSWLVVTMGFLSGGLLIFLGEKLFTYLSKRKNIQTTDENQGKRRSLLLIFSITLHNIPEGLAVGVAFGSIAYGLEGATLASACVLAIGIGIQNFPEGAAVSIPLRRDGTSRKKAFFLGQISGVVEPIAAVLGALLVLRARLMLPFLLAFAAGAMVYVVTVELIPESQTNSRRGLMAMFTILGFCIMMLLDVALG